MFQKAEEKPLSKHRENSKTRLTFNDSRLLWGKTSRWQHQSCKTSLTSGNLRRGLQGTRTTRATWTQRTTCWATWRARGTATWSSRAGTKINSQAAPPQTLSCNFSFLILFYRRQNLNKTQTLNKGAPQGIGKGADFDSFVAQLTTSFMGSRGGMNATQGVGFGSKSRNGNMPNSTLKTQTNTTLGFAQGT